MTDSEKLDQIITQQNIILQNISTILNMITQCSGHLIDIKDNVGDVC